MPKVLFRVIKAKPINWAAFKKEIERALDAQVKLDLIAYFKKVVKSWKHQPQFKAKKSIKPDSMSVDVFPIGSDAQIWRYVSQGTRGPYPIPKTPRPYHLRFLWGGYGSYKARTLPNGTYNGPGRVIGGKIHRPKQVSHPGIKARNFEKHIARWYAPKFKKVMDAAVKRGIAAAQKGAR